MGLLDAACRRGRLAGLLGRQLLARGLATSRFAGSLLQHESEKSIKRATGLWWTDLSAGHLSC